MTHTLTASPDQLAEAWIKQLTGPDATHASSTPRESVRRVPTRFLWRIAGCTIIGEGTEEIVKREGMARPILMMVMQVPSNQ